jgi:hypothetical protein
MDNTIQDRFDALLTAMLLGSAPSAGKTSSSDQALGAETDACCDETQIHQDTLPDDAY